MIGVEANFESKVPHTDNEVELVVSERFVENSRQLLEILQRFPKTGDGAIAENAFKGTIFVVWE